MKLSQSIPFALALFLLQGFAVVSAAQADQFCRNCPFNCRTLGIGKKDCSERPPSRGQCCVDLDDNGQEELRRQENPGYGHHDRNCGGSAHDDRCGRDRKCNGGQYDQRCGRDKRCGSGQYDQRCGRDRDNHFNWGAATRDPRRNDPGAYDDRNGFQPGDCPRGYHVNDRMCTNDERSRGCSDVRSPSGKTCVGWNVR